MRAVFIQPAESTDFPFIAFLLLTKTKAENITKEVKFSVSMNTSV